MLVLIPAYQPGERLGTLVRELLTAEPDLDVLVVDDGSGPTYDDAFAATTAAGATLLRHDRNRGKGAALKTGFRHALADHPGSDVVTADSDGQHRVDDILRVASAVDAGDGALVLGARHFTGDVPLRSRVGNAIARSAFTLATGLRLRDTQTGLRGVPAQLLPALVDLPGDGFEYELNQLLSSPGAGRRIREVPIATVYLDQNASSHFRPLADSARVMSRLGRYLTASIGSFVVDLLVLQLAYLLTGALLPAVVIARALSGAANFLANRYVVFPPAERPPFRLHALRYFLLAAVLLVTGYAGLAALVAFGIPVVIAKVLVDSALYAAGYAVQRGPAFRRRPFRAPEPTGTAVSGVTRELTKA